MNTTRFIKRTSLLIGLLFLLVVSACGNESEESKNEVHKVENEEKEVERNRVGVIYLCGREKR